MEPSNVYLSIYASHVIHYISYIDGLICIYISFIEFWWNFEVEILFGFLQVVLDNGIVKVTLSKSQGTVIEIEYGSIDNMLETLNLEAHRGYVHNCPQILKKVLFQLDFLLIEVVFFIFFVN